jgi:hypothetical protein
MVATMVEKCKGIVCCTLPTAFKNDLKETLQSCSFGFFSEYEPMCRCCNVCREQCAKDAVDVE